MEAALRQSKAMCPFMKKASAAKLRAMSTVARPQAQASSPCGGTMSKLQLYAHRCPVMGKALTVQGAQPGRSAVGGSSFVPGGIRAMSSHSKPGKARIHTSSAHEARAVEGNFVGAADSGKCAPVPSVFSRG